jgi:lipopolysaccharide/colanic/teichoic acid biosynthesis glycosyltransferase
MKRLLDLLAALAGLIVLAPVLAAAACAVWLEDGHAPLFCGKRVARRGAPGGPHFRMLKFRTMIPDAWRTGVCSTAAGDRRITRAGAWLRRAKIDELPQLWNVLTGDMSLVGPRPQVEADAALYTAEEARLLEVRPGITDPASIVFADEGEILKGSEDPDLLYNQIIRPWKSRLALFYLERRSVASDWRVILLTLLAAVWRQRALEAVAAMLAAWNAPGELIAVARRSGPLRAAPPPGAVEIVKQYPRAVAAGGQAE